MSFGKIIAAFALAMLFCLILAGSHAQTTSGTPAVNIGALTLAGFDGLAAPTLGSKLTGVTGQNETQANLTIGTQALAAINLSSYAADRRSGDLSGYTNIMYPLGESRGFTASAAGGGGGGGCGGGCG